MAVRDYLPDEKQPEGLEELFQWLELSNKRTGKVAFVKALDIFPKEHRRFIRGLSELRNQLVHDVRNVSFSFSEYLAGLNAEKRKAFVRAFTYGLREHLTFEGKEVSREEWVTLEPRWGVWFSGLYCMTEIAGCLGYVEQTKSLADLKAELLEKQQEFIKAMTEKMKGSEIQNELDDAPAVEHKNSSPS